MNRKDKQLLTEAYDDIFKDIDPPEFMPNRFEIEKAVLKAIQNVTGLKGTGTEEVIIKEINDTIDDLVDSFSYDVAEKLKKCPRFLRWLNDEPFDDDSMEEYEGYKSMGMDDEEIKAHKIRVKQDLESDPEWDARTGRFREIDKY